MASIFILLTFVAGIDGMNFEVMPELHWRWSYPLVNLADAGMQCRDVGLFIKNEEVILNTD